MLDETIVYIGTLRRIADASIGTHLEESLPDSLVNNDKSVLGESSLVVVVKAIFFLNNLVELLKLVADDLSPH